MNYPLLRLWYKLPASVRWTLIALPGGGWVGFYSAAFLSQRMDTILATWIGFFIALVSMPLIVYGGYRAEAYLKEKVWAAWRWFYGA